VWIPPSAFLSQLIVQVDLLSGPWQPAAGWTYGTVQALDVEWSPDQADRDQLNGVNNVNPFTAMPGGYVMMGNKTLYRTPNVYAGLHVRRLLIYAKVLVRAVAQTLLMSPINATTMQRFTQLCNGPLNSIASQQGLQQFLVVCNQSNNPVTSRVTRTLNGYVILQPNDVAERIVVQFAATSDAAVFTNTTVSPVGS
jgi:phage tail sheath protein FI